MTSYELSTIGEYLSTASQVISSNKAVFISLNRDKYMFGFIFITKIKLGRSKKIL